MATGWPPARGNRRFGGISIDEIILAYLEHAESYYVKNGQPTSTQQHIRDALKPLHDLYGQTPANEFGPLALKAVRDRMVEMSGRCRTTINKAVAIIRRVFKWAAENELVPASVYHALQTVSGLRRGRCAAKETGRVKPAPMSLIKAVFPHVSRQVRKMVRLQLLTGMRPGEVVLMRGCDFDTMDSVWHYMPATHKTEHHDQERVICLGPKAQAIVRPFLKPDPAAYLFSPTDAEVERRAKMHRRRKTPLSCGNRPGTNRRNHAVRSLGSRYTVSSYGRAIDRACEAAFPPPERLRQLKVPAKKGYRWETRKEWERRLGPEQWAELRQWRENHRWSPNQLRHNAATYLRKEFGLDAARTILGHNSPVVTEIYAELDRDKAAAIMSKVG